MFASNLTIDDMFPRAQPVMRAPLPKLKTKQIATVIDQKALAKGLHLTHEHQAVIDFVLDFYEHCDDCQNARTLADLLNYAFAQQGGRKYLYRLFPHGPLTTIHELADLPALGHQTDQSFGTRW